MDAEEYAEAVLLVVERIPPGRATTYGTIAGHLGVGGSRRVGRVLALDGGSVAWWRVVRADGSLPLSHLHEAREHYLQEGTALRASGRVDLRHAFWEP